MSPAARTLRALLVAGLVAGFAVAWGPEGFWACVPGALVLAGAEPTARAALASGALVVLAAAVAAPPPLMPALVVVPASLGVLLALRARLERERDAMRSFALRDPLTGLANRRALDERLGYEIARHTRHGESFSVLALDLDGFKAVNDRFGHDAGDEVLCETASALVGAVRAQDTVVRLGGDEFCVLAPQTDAAHAEHLVERVRESLAAVTTGVSGLSASIGTAVFPADGTTPEGLLAEADKAAHRGQAPRPHRPPPAARGLSGRGQPVGLLAGALDLLALVGAGLRPRLAAREREPEDRALHHPELLEERARVVGQLVALADLPHARGDLAVAGGRHVRVEVVLDLVAEVAADHVEERAALDVGRAEQLAHVARRRASRRPSPPG